MRVAWPTSTSSSPVANGSRVPACPTRVRIARGGRRAPCRNWWARPACPRGRPSDTPGPSAHSRALSSALDPVQTSGTAIPAGEAGRPHVPPATLHCAMAATSTVAVRGPQAHLGLRRTVPGPLAHQGRHPDPLDAAQLSMMPSAWLSSAPAFAKSSGPSHERTNRPPSRTSRWPSARSSRSSLGRGSALVDPAIHGVDVQSDLLQLRRHAVGPAGGVASTGSGPVSVTRPT